MRDKIKIDPNWDNLTKDAAAARNAGMRYGDYIAARHEAEQERERLGYDPHTGKSLDFYCKYCGGLIPQSARDSGFCCPDCEKRWNRNRRAAQEREAQQAEKHCVYCGAPLLGKQKLYCDVRCQYLFNQEKMQAQKKKRENKARICHYCGGPILGAKSNYMTYCSEECKKGARYQRLKERVAAAVTMEEADE